MASRRWLGLAVVGLVACGGSVFDPATDGGSQDAQGGDSAVADASTDAPAYEACMSDSGQLDTSLKLCQSNADCVIRQEQTDCCGTILYVGVAKASAARFDACEAAWESHFPGCGCASNKTSTEDGKSTPFGSDGGGPAVRCTDFTSGGGICMTYTP